MQHYRAKTPHASRMRRHATRLIVVWVLLLVGIGYVEAQRPDPPPPPPALPPQPQPGRPQRTPHPNDTVSSDFIPSPTIGKGQPDPTTTPTPIPRPTLPAPDDPVTALPPITIGTDPATGAAILVNSATGAPFEVRGVNYNRPSVDDATICPELQFGVDTRCSWDSITISSDLELLRDYGVNTVRLFLNYYTFGGATENYANYPLGVPMQRLEEFLDLANQNGIYVMPVLLAKYPQHRFGPEHYETALSLHVRPVVQFLAERPGIIAWDIFNEPDLGGPVDSRCWDWANADYDQCLPLANERQRFLQMLHDEMRRLDPERPLTISLGFAKNYFQPPTTMMRLADLVDFYAFHYYDNEPYDSGRYQEHWYYGQGFPHDLQRSIAELHALNLNKPIVITEIGYPSGEGHLRRLEDTHRDLATSMQIAREMQTSGMMLWSFRTYPDELLGGVFW
jgi:hypothetical protein